MRRATEGNKLSQRLLVKGESLKRTTENEKSNRTKIRQ